MLKLVEEKPDVTSEKMQAQLDLPIKNRRLAICFTRRVSLKKMLYVREQDREDVATRREEWAAQQPLLKPSKLVFLDESGIRAIGEKVFSIRRR